MDVFGNLVTRFTRTDLETALIERQQVTTSCAYCGWSVTGSLAETRISFTTHRLARHPEVVPVMPNVRMRALKGWKPRPEYEEAIDRFRVAA